MSDIEFKMSTLPPVLKFCSLPMLRPIDPEVVVLMATSQRFRRIRKLPSRRPQERLLSNNATVGGLTETTQCSRLIRKLPASTGFIPETRSLSELASYSHEFHTRW